MEEIGYSSNSTMNLFCDNKTAIEIAHNPMQHDRTKHVEVDRHFIKQKLEAKIVQFPFVKSEYQLADILTKAVSTKCFIIHWTSWALEISMHQLERECWHELLMEVIFPLISESPRLQP